MFPWSPEFTWDAGHLVFFGALYSVLTSLAGALGLAAWRATRALREGRAAAVAWHADFEDLPASARACRHQLTGEAPGRVCENAFDCRHCLAHAGLEARRAVSSGAAAVPVRLGFELPPDRYYHRGHTWARVDQDGTIAVGLDDLARRLLGEASAVELPAVGARLQAHAPLARLRARGREVRVLSPIDGTVTAVAGSGCGFTVTVVAKAPLDLRHLLRGTEASAWGLRELERLQQVAAGAGSATALADGGELVADVGAVLEADRYDAVLGDMLLEP